MVEKNYDFRKRHWTVHQPDRRDMTRTAGENEVLLESGWYLGGNGGTVTENALRDFQDYLWVSMGVSVGGPAGGEDPVAGSG